MIADFWRLPARVACATLVLAGCASISPYAGDNARIAAVVNGWDDRAHGDLRSIVVMRGGQVVAERYFGDETPATLHDIRSAGKSVTSLLLAIAIDGHAIHDVSDRVDVYWPQARGSAIGDVTLAQLLTMRSGLAAFDDDPASPGNEDRLDAAPDPLAFALAVPRASSPGTVYRYNSLTAWVAGIVVEKASGRSMADFARDALFEPLGIDEWRWDADAAGHTKGQGNLWLTARGMATLGELVRRGGEYRGRRIVSEAGVDAALKARVSIADTDPYADGYGYFWYSKSFLIDGRPIAVSFASGSGGNKIYVVPQQDLVVAIASSAYGFGYGQRRSQEILKTILGASRQRGQL